MKKTIFTLLVLLAPVFLFAQGLGVGLKVGANFSNISSDNVDTEGITSYHVGAYANIKFSDKFGVTPELLWSAQGAEFDNAKLETDYVLVPIMLRYKVVDLISLEAGPQLNFLTSAKIEDIDVKDQIKSSSYSLGFGAVAHLPMGFNGGLRYVVGMSDLSEDGNDKFKDRTFQIWVGWTLFGAK